jgi:hypothetical protein
MNNNAIETDGNQSPIIEVRGLWKIFGPHPEQVLESEELKRADRQEVQQEPVWWWP